MALSSSEISYLAAAGLTAENIAAVVAMEERRDEAKRSKNRECVRAFRERQRNLTNGRAAKPPRKRKITSVGDRKITPPECKITPANPLKVSRNSESPREQRGETYKEGGRGTLQVSSLSENKPSEFAAVAAFEPEVPKVVPMRSGLEFSAPQQPLSVARSPEKTLYDDAAVLLGKGSGSLVSQLLKLHDRSVPVVRRIFELASGTSDPKAYCWGALKKQKEFLNREELDRKQVAEWRPTSANFPNRDYSHPRAPYYIISKVDKTKKLWLGDQRVEDAMALYYEERGYVDGR